jgi:two-component system, chemotaxis family, CheB/CheR fusion protein
VTSSARTSPERSDAAGLESLLQYLKSNRGFDFSGYKRSSLERRIRKRMREVGIERYEDYQDHLEVTPDEYTELFNTILINVTGFYRDKPAWDYLSTEVVPQILAAAGDSDPIRAWSAACATGEEAYTIAMVLAEALGDEEFRRRVKIYATDVDDEALVRARHGAYARDALKPLPEGFRAGYFEPGPLGYTFRGDLRRSVIFGRNDMVQDAPISRIDLLVSRNALMYFTPEAQARILSHFNFALKDTGFLFLGKSEMLITHADLFTPYELKWRVFKKVPRVGLRDRVAFLPDARIVAAIEGGHQGELQADAFDTGPVATVVVDRRGVVTGLNHRARTLFHLAPADVGRPFHDLELSYRPADLRTALERAYSSDASVRLGRVEWTAGSGDATVLDISVSPMPRSLGAAIYFEDVTETARLDEEFERSKRQLETAYEELQSTVEELETTNEELQSTNEELETTNEELQSSNEELETMNEELQSTNDELEAMNEEQQRRTHEVDKLNLYLEGILGSIGVGVVVLDRQQRVQVWNANSTELWGLRPDEVDGRHFLELDIGLPIAQLKEPIRRVLQDDTAVVEEHLEAVTRTGKAVRMRVRTLPLRRGEGQPYGAILLMTSDGAALAGS